MRFSHTCKHIAMSLCPTAQWSVIECKVLRLHLNFVSAINLMPKKLLIHVTSLHDAQKTANGMCVCVCVGGCSSYLGSLTRNNVCILHKGTNILYARILRGW